MDRNNLSRTAPRERGKSGLRKPKGNAYHISGL